MKRRMSTVHRLVRAVVLAPLAVWLALTAGAGTVLGVVALVFAGIMLATGASGYCPAVHYGRTREPGRKLARPTTVDDPGLGRPAAWPAYPGYVVPGRSG